MDAHTRQLEAIFDPNVFFQVPLFQRPYVWKQAENWEPLWEDIQALLDRQLLGAKAKAHFLGAIVLEQLPHSAGSIETRQVIDGQQRFTTLQLFLLAARNLARANGSTKFGDRFSGLVENDASRVEDKEEKYKLWPTNGDRPAFQSIHACGSLNDVDKAVKAKPEVAKSNLVGAYRYFHLKLDDWLRGALDEDDDKPALATKTVDDRLDAVWSVVKAGLQLVVIDLGPEDETQVIFETLNARGADLLPADLIKNYLFRKARTQNADVETLYEDHWSRFETDFWREEVKQGRLIRPRIDLFVNHYLTLMTQDEVRSNHLFTAFKSFVEDDEPGQPKDAAGHIEKLAQYADVFFKFYVPGDHVELARFLRLLQAIDTATIFPFLLFAYAELMPDKKAEFDRVLLVLESFLMRRLVTNWTSKNYNRLFVDLIKAVAPALSANAVAAHLAKGTGESTKFPNDMELATFVLEQPLYDRIAQYKVRAVLETVEEASQSKKSPVLPLTEKLTIEHVMPQTWQKHWPLPASVTADPITEQKTIVRRGMLLNSLGNLTLITGSFNSSLQNAAWADKRPELLKYGKLNLTQYFHGSDADEWGEVAIQRRSTHLLKLLVGVWPDIATFA
ncbi:MAG: DUF262 domain-containing protein [Rudaea sp.]|uniref:DUF262 domain-containing protein n=1 Tax=unclassified Rudaea TaxID=2627037 RepID=UPI0010F57BFE|nr:MULTISPECIES: DUF262 domain-containing protein [unclassified Rudaea]MBN8884444.1 DUF262 domain-containing protein [Rudaea sp.]